MLNKSFDSDSTPAYFFDKLRDITPDDIRSMGAKAVAVDIDNTCSYDFGLRPFESSKHWVREMVAAGLPVVILTNTYVWRARRMSEQLGNIPYIAKADKPAKEGYLKAAALAGVNINELAMIGDQLFTDIQGANGAGAISVRVRYTRRELLMGIRYRFLRRKENKYLIKAGYGDKI